MTKGSKREIHLRLYVAGDTGLSRQALINLRNILASFSEKELRLEVIDVLEDPLRGISERILATPTLEKIYPPPKERMIGDLSDYAKVLSILKKEAPSEVSHEEETRGEDRSKPT